MIQVTIVAPIHNQYIVYYHYYDFCHKLLFELWIYMAGHYEFHHIMGVSLCIYIHKVNRFSGDFQVLSI